MEISTEVVAVVQGRLGPLYEQLLTSMLDLAVPPIFMSHSQRERLVEPRQQCVSVLEDRERSEPEVVRSFVDLLPKALQLPNSAESLLEAATWRDYFAVPESVFRIPTAGDRLFAEPPELLEWVDEDGLLDVTELDARPHGLFQADLSIHYHQFLRRNFAATVHHDLVGAVLGIADRTGTRARLAVDERRIRYRSEHEEFEERDYWRGPPLNVAALDTRTLSAKPFMGTRTADSRSSIPMSRPRSAGARPEVSRRWRSRNSASPRSSPVGGVASTIARSSALTAPSTPTSGPTWPPSGSAETNSSRSIWRA